MATTQRQGLTVNEFDEGGNVVSTYVQSSGKSDDQCRFDNVTTSSTKPWWNAWVLDVFLPTGYPNSVTDDYTEYQIYDSLQAFASSIVSLIASRAVLASVGVGDATASAMAAVIYNVLEQMAGRLATIAFAHRFGTSLEPECKMYRLLADVLNDVGFLLDCLSPNFSKPYRVVLLSTSGVLRALCGVAAGSAKASLSAHFACRGNLGELNAKDSSQETVISLAGMLFGIAVVPLIRGPFWTWTALIVLLSVHLEMNRRAVRAVKMKTLSRQRATLLYHHLKQGHVPSPSQISSEEMIFGPMGVLCNHRRIPVGRCTVGISFSTFLQNTSSLHTATGAATSAQGLTTRVLDKFRERPYVLWFARDTTDLHVLILIKSAATTTDIVTAWWEALAFAEITHSDPTAQISMRSLKTPHVDTKTIDRVLTSLDEASVSARSLIQKFGKQLEAHGWDWHTAAIETNPKRRVQLVS